MARESSDPEQTEAAGYFSDDPSSPLPVAKDIVLLPESPGQRAEPKPGVSAGASASPAPPPQPGAPPSQRGDAAAELRRQLDASRQAAMRAEAIARDAVLRAAQAEQGRSAANIGMLDSAIESGQRASHQARLKFEAALNIGDHKSAADAQVELNDARANLLRLQEQRALIEEETRYQQFQAQQQPQPQPRAPQPQRHDPELAMDNVTRQLLSTGFPRSADWLRNHPEYVSTPAMMGAIEGAHKIAVARYQPDTDEYFDALENALGIGRQSTRGASPPRMAAHPRSSAMASAPVSSAAPSLRTGQSRGVTVHLTQAMRDHAHNVLGMTDEEYAAELERAREEGKLIGART